MQANIGFRWFFHWGHVKRNGAVIQKATRFTSITLEIGATKLQQYAYYARALIKSGETCRKATSSTKAHAFVLLCLSQDIVCVLNGQLVQATWGSLFVTCWHCVVRSSCHHYLEDLVVQSLREYDPKWGPLDPSIEDWWLPIEGWEYRLYDY